MIDREKLTQQREEESVRINRDVRLCYCIYIQLVRRQLELEENAIDVAVHKYQQMKSEVEKIGQGVSLRPAQMLLADWFEPLTSAIREEQFNIKYHDDFSFLIEQEKYWSYFGEGNSSLYASFKAR